MEQLVDYVAISPSSASGLVWLQDKGPAKAGSSAFACFSQRYYRGTFNGRRVLAHRIVFYLAHGYWPEQVDHIDGDTRNNQVSNLREVTRTENMHNRVELGIYKRKDGWCARIWVNGVRKYLGVYSTAEEARLVYLSAKRKHHPTTPKRCFN